MQATRVVANEIAGGEIQRAVFTCQNAIRVQRRAGSDNRVDDQIRSSQCAAGSDVLECGCRAIVGLAEVKFNDCGRGAQRYEGEK